MEHLSRAEFLRYATAATLPLFTGMPFSVTAALAPGFSRGMAMAKIPSTGEDLPRIGLGTYQILDGIEPQQAAALFREFFSLGGRLVDSSPMYGNAEAVTGKVSTELGLNGQLFMATKVWISGRERGVHQMADSLQKMGRKKLELMQIHNLVDWRTQLKTLREYKEQGIYKYIGLTHYMTSAFGELARILKAEKLDFLQIPYSLGETTAENQLLGVAAERGVAVIANEPFGQGALFSRVRGKAVPAWAVEKGITSWAQYFLKFILSEPRVQFVIPATRKLAHLKDNMSAGLGYLPTAEERRKMRQEFL